MDIKNFVKDRDSALLSLDAERILAYCEKYGIKAPENELVFWAAVHKTIACGMQSATAEQRDRSKDWLVKNGFKPRIF